MFEKYAIKCAEITLPMIKDSCNVQTTQWYVNSGNFFSWFKWGKEGFQSVLYEG